MGAFKQLKKVPLDARHAVNLMDAILTRFTALSSHFYCFLYIPQEREEEEGLVKERDTGVWGWRLVSISERLARGWYFKQREYSVI